MRPQRIWTAMMVGMALALAAVPTAGTSAAADTQRPTTSTSTFRLLPREERVEVVVRITVTNRLSDRVTLAPCPGAPARTCRTTTRFYIDSFGYFYVQTGTRDLAFSGPGVKADVANRSDTFTNYVVRFSPIYEGQSTTFRASYHLPAAWPRSPNNTRITDAYAHFCWHGEPTDRGTVTAVLPHGYEPVTRYGAVSTKKTKHGVTLEARRNRDLRMFYACTDSFKAEKLVRTETLAANGQVIRIEGWPEDPDWADHIRAGIEQTLPALEQLAGMPIPSDEVVIREVASQALGGYAGEFTTKSDQIRVEERYDDPVLVAHELAHAWYNGSSVKDTWLSEGFAEWMAHEANRRACANPGEYPGRGRLRLRDWRYLGADPSERDEAIVDYQYAAACDIVQRVEWLAGLERMDDISTALLERTPKYGGTASARAPRPDWREWLDAVDEVGQIPTRTTAAGVVPDLLVEYGVATAVQLRGRASARAEYHDALDGPWGADMPVAVRDLMDAWRFTQARAAIGVADDIVALALAAEEDTGRPIRVPVGGQIRDAATLDELRDLKKRVAADPLSFLPVSEPPAPTLEEVEPDVTPTPEAGTAREGWLSSIRDDR